MKNFILVLSIILISKICFGISAASTHFNFSQLKSEVRKHYDLDNLFKDKNITFELKYRVCEERKYQKSTNSRIFRVKNIGENFKYVSEIKITKGNFKKEIKVGGFSLTGNTTTISFQNNCSKIIPHEFTSFKKQKYYDNLLYPGDTIERFSMIQPEKHMGHEMIRINASGYFFYPDQEPISSKQLEKLQKMPVSEYVTHLNRESSTIKDFTDGCLKISRNKEKSNQKNYIYDGESFSDKEVFLEPITYEKDAASIYFGHRLCSNVPNAKLMCDRFTPNWEYSKDERFSEKLLSRGRECTDAVKKYEKVHKVKIPVSPFLEKEDIENLKKQIN